PPSRASFSRNLNAMVKLRNDRRMAAQNSFATRTPITVGDTRYQIFSLPALERAGFAGVSKLPYSLRILLENLLRHEDGRGVDRDDIEALARWDVAAP